MWLIKDFRFLYHGSGLFSVLLLDNEGWNGRDTRSVPVRSGESMFLGSVLLYVTGII